MKSHIQRRLLIVIILTAIVGGITQLLYNVSYNPNFSFVDAISGATRKSHSNSASRDIISTWNYTRDDIALPDDNSSIETVITTGKVAYRLLENRSIASESKTAILLSNKEDISYQNAVNVVAEYLGNEGYDIQIKEYSEIMMLSMAHAGKFTFFLMDEEVVQ